MASNNYIFDMAVAKESVHEGKGYEQDPTLTGIAFLSVQVQRGWKRGTGFLVEIEEGHCIVLTAAHCLYDDEAGCVAKRVESPSVVIELADIYVPHTYRPKEDKDFEQDYGFIYLRNTKYFQEHKDFELMSLNRNKIARSNELVITGYPAEITQCELNLYHQYSVKLTDIECNPQRRFLTYKDATSGDMSGAPLYFKSSAGHFAFGIHVNGENGAVWLTADEIRNIREAVMRIAAGFPVKWQHHEITDELQATHDREAATLLNPSAENSSCRDPRPVSCPPMTYSREMVYRFLDVSEDGRELVNAMESGQEHHSEQFLIYRGTGAFSLIPLLPSPSNRAVPIYWETSTRIQVKRGLPWLRTLLEMGVTEEGQVNTTILAPGQRPNWTLSVRGCGKHPGFCIQVWGVGSQCGECQTDTLTNTSGTDVTLRYGCVLDMDRGRLAFIDVDREIVLHKFDVRFTHPLPLFGVWPWAEEYSINMRLVNGGDIEMTDRKRALILSL